jgi:hypothetical protein
MNNAIRPTYQEILCELLLVALDLPPRVPSERRVRPWLHENRLIEDFETDNLGIIGTGLTNTGEALLGQNLADFRESLHSLHRGGFLKPNTEQILEQLERFGLVEKATNDGKEENDHDTQQQRHDGGKGSARKKVKGRAS